ncbi:MAG: hypothetical protein R2880_13995 [Deinococcales bacterium]
MLNSVVAATDEFLKRYFHDFIADIAAWILKQPILSAETSGIELSTTNIKADNVFKVMLQTGQELLLHIEFEAASKAEAMKWRMLDYMSRLSRQERKRLYSVVLYLGHAGKGDEGRHQVESLEESCLHWSYQVIRLAELPAQTLLALEKPTLLSLIGLCKLEAPKQELSQAVARIRQEADNEDKRRLLNILVNLLPTKELAKMIQEWSSTAEFLENLPIMQLIREEREEGREEGREETLQQTILNALILRFKPDEALKDMLGQRLALIEDLQVLNKLFEAAILSESLETFLNVAEFDSPS